MMAGLFEKYDPKTFNGTIARGSLISFHYPISHAKEPYEIHDPYPMIVITDIWPRIVRGVNLHYLTFPYIKTLLQNHCQNTGFSYASVKPDRYLAKSFRVYYRSGMRQMKVMDCKWLLTMLGAVRSFSENELQQIQNQIQAQIQAKLQAKAEELTNYEQFRNHFLQQNQGFSAQAAQDSDQPFDLGNP